MLAIVIIFLCQVGVPSMTLSSCCVDDTCHYRCLYFFCTLDVLGSSFYMRYCIQFQCALHLTLVNIGGVLLLFLMLPWFDGVSYVFNICSYVLGGCSGWAPMHFGEMDHLPYRHSSFHSYFGCSLTWFD